MKPLTDDTLNHMLERFRWCSLIDKGTPEKPAFDWYDLSELIELARDGLKYRLTNRGEGK